MPPKLLCRPLPPRCSVSSCAAFSRNGKREGVLFCCVCGSVLLLHVAALQAPRQHTPPHAQGARGRQCPRVPHSLQHPHNFPQASPSPCLLHNEAHTTHAATPHSHTPTTLLPLPSTPPRACGLAPLHNAAAPPPRATSLLAHPSSTTITARTYPRHPHATHTTHTPRIGPVLCAASPFCLLCACALSFARASFSALA